METYDLLTEEKSFELETKDRQKGRQTDRQTDKDRYR